MSSLALLYGQLVGWTSLGWAIAPRLPVAFPDHLGRWLFWLGVPLGILGFLRHAPLSPQLGLAPLVAWGAIAGGLLLARLCLGSSSSSLRSSTRGSVLLAAMVGNTGYLGFPVALTAVDPNYFPWALFYDLLGSTPAAYGLGVAIALGHGVPADGSATESAQAAQSPTWRSAQVLRAIAVNPAMWSFGLGLMVKDLPWPEWIDQSLRLWGWGTICLALVLVGLRLRRLKIRQHSLRWAIASLAIKMLILPLLVAVLLRLGGLHGPVFRVLVLQSAMPPAFATLVLAEAYDLDRDLAVTALALGAIALVGLLPLLLSLLAALD